MFTKPPYKDKGGRWYTRALFQEQYCEIQVSDRPKDFTPVFTIHTDREGFINAHKTFVECNDPTGYRWAIMYLGSWDHFVYLQRSIWFKEALRIWQDELTHKMKSVALGKIQDMLFDPDMPQAQKLAAAKYIADEGYKSTAKRGRPSKEEVNGELKAQVRIVQMEDDDAERIGLKVVKK